MVCNRSLSHSLQPMAHSPGTSSLTMAKREELHGAAPPGALPVNFKNWGGFHMVLDCKLIFVS